MHAHIRSLIFISAAAALATISLVCTPAASAADQGLVGWGEYKLPNAEIGLIAKVAAGRDFTIALRRDGTLVGWGADGRDGTSTGGHAATPPAGNEYADIAAGLVHALALKNDQTIVAWGYDQNGTVRNTPPGTFLDIAAGDTSNVAIRTDGSSPGQGSLLQWGAALRNEPQFALPTGNDFTAVAAGVGHFLALRANGSIAAWGPIGLSQNDAPPGTGFTAIAAGGYHCLALRSADGSIEAWGRNLSGQATEPPETGFIAIAAGGSHSLARRANGSIHAWGLGSSIFGASVETGFEAMAAGEQHCVAVRANGTVTEWGKTGLGLTAPHSGVAQAVASRFHGLALMQNGSLVGWGANDVNQATPPAGNNFKAVAVGDQHSVALNSDGSIVVWGRENPGEPPPLPTETGFFAIGAAREHNVAIKAVGPLAGSLVFWGNDPFALSDLPPGNDFTAIAVGRDHCLALRSDGSIVGWGRNVEGQVAPQAGEFAAIAVGNLHSLALKKDGSIVAWGSNALGQATAPTATTTYTAICAGGDLSGAVTAAGTLVTWGSGGGAFGGTGAPPAGTGFTKISAGVTYFMALGIATPPPPAPEITSPKAGDVFVEGGPVTVVATIPGDRTLLQQAQLLVNGAVQRERTQIAPLAATVVFPPLPELQTGTYSLSVRVEAVNGTTATSDSVLVHVPSPVDICFLVSFGELLPFVGQPSRVDDGEAPIASAGRTPPAMAMSVFDLDLNLFRKFRDDVLSANPAGRYYTDLYNRMSLPLIQTVLAHPAQITPIYDALVEWTPAIQALVNNQGGTVTITPAMVATAQTILTDLRAVATGELAAIMDAETTALNPTTWSGLSIDQLLDRVESQTRPPPAITTQPSAQSVAAGGTLLLAVEGDGAGPFTYQWFKNGIAITGATGATYTVPSAQRFHAGDYTVTVSNPFGGTPSNAAAFAVNAPAANDARLLNLSTRGLAEAGANQLFPGFVVSGTGTKKLLIRAIGPSLGALVPSFTVIPDPRMQLKRYNFATNAYDDYLTNDDWQTNTNAADITTTSAQLFAFALTDPKDSALLVDLAPGQYAVVGGDKNDASGIAIVELYDADAGNPTTRLINISNRGFCGVGNEVMIPGFVVSSEGPKTLLVRVVGPKLGFYGVPGTMVDPKLTFYRTNPATGANTELFTQDNWSDSPDAVYTATVATQVSAFPLDAGSKDAAFVVTLEPGVYTVVGASAVAGATGVVLVEVYVVP